MEIRKIFACFYIAFCLQTETKLNFLRSLPHKDLWFYLPFLFAPEKEVRERALEELVHLPPSECIPILFYTIVSSRRFPREKALQVLLTLDPEISIPVIEEFSPFYPQTVNFCLECIREQKVVGDIPPESFLPRNPDRFHSLVNKLGYELQPELVDYLVNSPQLLYYFLTRIFIEYSDFQKNAIHILEMHPLLHPFLIVFLFPGEIFPVYEAHLVLEKKIRNKLFVPFLLHRLETASSLIMQYLYDILVAYENPVYIYHFFRLKERFYPWQLVNLLRKFELDSQKVISIVTSQESDFTEPGTWAVLGFYRDKRFVKKAIEISELHDDPDLFVQIVFYLANTVEEEEEKRKLMQEKILPKLSFEAICELAGEIPFLLTCLTPEFVAQLDPEEKEKLIEIAISSGVTPPWLVFV